MDLLDTLFDLIRIRETLSMLVSSSKDFARLSFENDTDFSLRYQKARESFLDKVANIVTIDEIVEDMKELYRTHFTLKDIEVFIAFYSSEAGQHFLDAQPAIQAEHQSILMDRIRIRMAGLKKEVEQYFEKDSL